MFYLKTLLLTAAALVAWAAVAVYSTLAGWWHDPLVADPSPDSFMEAIRTRVSTDNVGNVALVLIEDGKVHAEHFAAVTQDIDRETLFPTASISKWITALGVMTLVRSGDIDLDVPVSAYLTRWQLPASEFDRDGVTVRRLLSHNSGLSDGLGFGDYQPDEAIPTLEESLRNPRASSGEDVRIALGREPGSEWDYSGGGYLILQLIVEEVTGQTFEAYLQSALLQPLGMTRSTFDYIGDSDNATISYAADGSEAVLFRYAASAATGFASSASDLTRLVRALAGRNALPATLDRATIDTMRTPHGKMFGLDIWGLGTILYARTASGDFVYGHDGQNEPAINAAVRINPDTGDAIIVLTSGNPSLATYLGFEWVFWQTGNPDMLGIGYVKNRGTTVFKFGAALILILAPLGAWWMRRRRLTQVS